MTTKTIKPKFLPGKVYATQAFMDKVKPRYAFTALEQHLNGEWGLVGQEDWEMNDMALQDGRRILSVYALPDDEGEFWIITEADRSATTFLLPSEY